MNIALSFAGGDYIAQQFGDKVRDEIKAKIAELNDAGVKDVQFNYRTVLRGPHAINGPAVEFRVTAYYKEKEGEG